MISAHNAEPIDVVNHWEKGMLGQQLQIGEQAQARLIVHHSDTARRLALSEADDFPEVFATSRMIALMEVAAARAMQRLLGPNELSVGVSVCISHTAATPVASEVRAVATFLRTEGKLFHFELKAFDESGAIGEGTHSRAIVDTDRLLSGAARRRSAS